MRDWICVRCHTRLVGDGGTCSACGSADVVPTDTPRGQELVAGAHATVGRGAFERKVVLWTTRFPKYECDGDTFGRDAALRFTTKDGIPLDAHESF